MKKTTLPNELEQILTRYIWMEWGYGLISDTVSQQLLESIRGTSIEGEASAEEEVLLSIKKIQRLEFKKGSADRIQDYISFLQHFGIEYKGIDQLYRYIDGKTSQGDVEISSLGNHITNMINVFIAVAFRGSVYSKIYTLQALQQKMQDQKLLLDQAHKFSGDTRMKKSLGLYFAKNKLAYLMGKQSFSAYLDSSEALIAHMGCSTTDAQIRFVSGMLYSVFASVEDNQNIF